MAYKHQTSADMHYASDSGLQALGFAFAKGRHRYGRVVLASRISCFALTGLSVMHKSCESCKSCQKNSVPPCLRVRQSKRRRRLALRQTQLVPSAKAKARIAPRPSRFENNAVSCVSHGEYGVMSE